MGCHRSLGDIHEICEYYYPGVELDYIKKVLLSFGEDLVGHKCSTINKRIFRLRTHPNYKDWSQLSEGEKDEYGELIIYLNDYEAENIKL